MRPGLVLVPLHGTVALLRALGTHRGPCLGSELLGTFQLVLGMCVLWGGLSSGAERKSMRKWLLSRRLAAHLPHHPALTSRWSFAVAGRQALLLPQVHITGSFQDSCSLGFGPEVFGV